jgi:hypothetical protein
MTREVRFLAEDVGDEDQVRSLAVRAALQHLAFAQLSGERGDMGALVHGVVADAALRHPPLHLLAVGFGDIEQHEDMRAVARALAGRFLDPVTAADNDEVALLRPLAVGHIARLLLGIERHPGRPQELLRQIGLEDREILADAVGQALGRLGAVDEGVVAAAEAPQQPVRQEPARRAGTLAVILGEVIEADLMPVDVVVHLAGLRQQLLAQGGDRLARCGHSTLPLSGCGNEPAAIAVRRGPQYVRLIWRRDFAKPVFVSRW